MSKQRYKEYTESGVQWLGQLPSHWEVKRLKYSTVSCQNGVWGEEPEGDENDIICVRVADFDREKIRVSLHNPTIRNVAAMHRVSRAVQKGDLLLEKSGGGEKQPVGFVALYDEDQPAVCSNFVACMKLMHGMVPSFWRYVHAAGYSVGLNIRSIKQTSGIQNIDQASYLDERAPFPPVEEQQKIAAFLDRKTAEIDALIAKKRRLLDRLAEKRTALITRAVTKGLDPDVPMKDSGIEWLGEIPAHWDVAHLRRTLLKVEQGWSPECEDRPVTEGEWGVLKSGCVNGGEYDESNHKALPAGLEPRPSLQVQPSDILMCRASGSTRLIGSVAIVRETTHKLMFSDKTYRLSVDEDVMCSSFLVHSMGSKYMREQILLSISGAEGLANNIPQSAMKNYQICIPPLHEQKEIAGRIEQHKARIDQMESRIELAIERMKEYRSALITNAVTGQIKVA